MTLGRGTDSRPLVILALLVLVGGMNGVAVRTVVGELAPLWAASLRFLFAGILMAGAMIVLRIPIPRGAGLRGALLYGLIGFGINYACGYAALRDLPAGTAQVFTGLVPLITVGVAAVAMQERLSIAPVVGAIVAACGIAIVGYDALQHDAPLSAMGLAIGSAMAIAVSSVIVKGTPGMSPIATNAVGMLIGASALVAASVVVGEPRTIPSDGTTWLAMVFLVIGGSVTVFGLQLVLLRAWPASSAAYSFVLLPLATIPYGVILLSETITTSMLLGSVVALLGVYVGAIRGRRAPAAAAVPTV